MIVVIVQGTKVAVTPSAFGTLPLGVVRKGMYSPQVG
jgi:hypothetical protein